MPLEILLILVIGGISAIAVILHLTGRSHRAVLLPEDARAAWHRHFPDDMILGIAVARDGHAALIETEQGPGLLWSFGADTVGRHLRDFDVMDHPHGLRVLFHDFTAPQVTLHLSPDERRDWQARMTPR
ncbi:hypothetical protein [Ruegeria aquimaris]|uniref:Uncharacterized protein n=1 Tax=Ruegeria aquimaris TaxID=2984333 RepID=A0ABT3AHB3_9RHOB|nr:hypothetical protein [Ruegeria sp. XHP0148]MCV2888072.1 hypothetical protein [Ruegeria sp. XHP0148]